METYGSDGEFDDFVGGGEVQGGGYGGGPGGGEFRCCSGREMLVFWIERRSSFRVSQLREDAVEGCAGAAGSCEGEPGSLGWHGGGRDGRRGPGEGG